MKKMKIETDKAFLDPSIPEDGTFGVYPTDEGDILLVTVHAGVKTVCTIPADIWDIIALKGIQLGVVARTAAESRKIQVPNIVLPPGFPKAPPVS